MTLQWERGSGLTLSDQLQPGEDQLWPGQQPAGPDSRTDTADICTYQHRHAFSLSSYHAHLSPTGDLHDRQAALIDPTAVTPPTCSPVCSDCVGPREGLCRTLQGSAGLWEALQTVWSSTAVQSDIWWWWWWPTCHVTLLLSHGTADQPGCRSPLTCRNIFCWRRWKVWLTSLPTRNITQKLLTLTKINEKCSHLYWIKLSNIFFYSTKLTYKVRQQHPNIGQLKLISHLTEISLRKSSIRFYSKRVTDVYIFFIVFLVSVFLCPCPCFLTTFSKLIRAKLILSLKNNCKVERNPQG